ncbi:MAG TPA: EVE domain-containing protein [Bacteroidetes bacterium]|nr:EVE domain-containing protein [Bacteroidota bacterium]
MQNFLLKTEPSEYSFDDLLRDKKTVWSGVSAAPALKNIRSMKKGDRAFIYHTGDEKQIVGIAKIISDPYPDPNDNNEKLFVIDIQAEQKLVHPVTLAVVKGNKDLAAMPLVRIGRLSVQPVTEREWDIIISQSKKSK